MEENAIGRRGLIAGAAALVAAGALAGCSGTRKVDPSKQYLPLGSVVRIVESKSQILQMIIARRPLTNVKEDRVTGEYSGFTLGTDEPYDYAAVRFPFGLASNVNTLTAYNDVPSDKRDSVTPANNNLLFKGDIICFNMNDIVEVLFCGYDDGDAEKRAAASLDEAKGTPAIGIEALSDQIGEQNLEIIGREVL